MQARLRADVEALAALTRTSAGAGERAAAAWVAQRLREAGARDVAVEPYRGSPTYAWAYALYAAAGLVAARARKPLLALAALLAYELDASGRAQPLRRLLPRGEGANVFARVPAAGARRATVALVAHHDAAHTGLIWRARLTKLGARPGSMPPDGALAALALALAAVPARVARGLAGALLAATVAAQLDIARSPTVPGANDNASGVAGVLELVRRLAADPLPGVEVLVAGVGCEESGMDGMRAWLDAHGEEVDLVLGLDTIGSGTPIVARAEARR
jgi:acetylornithine deacetylase/succinyl-diaminopimelate desuccinylase-like protein